MRKSEARVRLVTLEEPEAVVDLRRERAVLVVAEAILVDRGMRGNWIGSENKKLCMRWQLQI